MPLAKRERHLNDRWLTAGQRSSFSHLKTSCCVSFSVISVGSHYSLRISLLSLKAAEREKAALRSMGKGAVEPHSETSCNQNSSTLHVCRLTFALSACWTQFSWGLNCKQKLLCLICFHAIPILITPFSPVQRQTLTKKRNLAIYGPFSPHWKHHLVVVCGHLALILVRPASLPLESAQESVCCLSPEGADPFHLRTIALFFCLCDMMIFHCLAAIEIEKQ